MLRTTVCGLIMMATLRACVEDADDVSPTTVEERAEARAKKKANEEEKKRLNKMWLEGYGFNNDNAERARQGLPLKNFDGTIAKD